MRREICIRQIGLSNGIGQMELFCIGSNQNRTPTLGLRKLDLERGGKQGELAGTCTYFKCNLGLGFGKPRCCFSYLDKQNF
jgi:hypothetical protein